MPGLTVFDSRKVAALMMRFVRGDGLDDVSVAGAMGNVIYGLYSYYYCVADFQCLVVLKLV